MRCLSQAVLILDAVQLIDSLAVALPLSFFPNYVIGLGASPVFRALRADLVQPEYTCRMFGPFGA